MAKASEKYRSPFGKIKPPQKAKLPKALSEILNQPHFKGSNFLVALPAQATIARVGETQDQKSLKLESDKVTNKIGVEDARRALASAIVSGDISEEVISIIYRNDFFMPIEGVLLDYKRDYPSSRQAQLKVVKHIQSFHNTFGGYLVFGVEEKVKEIEIVPAYEKLENFDFKILRDLCREFLTAPIEIQAKTHVLKRGIKSFEITLVHIPSRKERIPVLVRKDAKDAEAKFILRRDDANLREGDNSIPASNFHHWRQLFGPRENPYLLAFDVLPERVRSIYSDLPDRDFICPDFIGRHDYLSKLFAWLADDFTCVRVLAGEGGLGKTSIAFQFASEVAKANLIDADSVIWLTAKRFQFRALINDYEELINCHFSSSRELFEVLATNLGETSANLDDIEERDFPKLLRTLGQHVKVFFVIDDLDSLPIDEQKRCIEVCQQLAGLGSRFLFTTRKNATASTSTAIEVEGLEENDYEKLVESWQDRLKIKEISPKDIRRLRETTHGSPLYTESLLRLVKNGMPVGEAIAKWKGNLGIDVRNAALKREVTQLGQEARKVLVAAAILGECSLAEIKIATDYSDQTLLDATNELQSLFLLQAPSIASQPRFSIAKTTKDLIISLGVELISDFGAFQERLKSRRLKSKGENQSINAVGVAVNQAMALIASGEPDDALKTVDEVSQSLKGKNKDLWFLRGRVLLKFPKPRLVDAKDAFMRAFDLGQRKAQFFGMWYDTLLDLEQCESAVEVATSALEASSGDKSEWLIKRAQARVRSAAVQDKRGDAEHTINQLNYVAEDFCAAGVADEALRWNASWLESFYRTHDSLWAVSTRSAASVPEWLDAFDGQLRCIKRGDTRLENYVRMKLAFDAILRLGKRESAGTQRAGNFIQQLTRNGKEVLKDAPREYKVYRDFRQIEAAFNL